MSVTFDAPEVGRRGEAPEAAAAAVRSLYAGVGLDFPELNWMGSPAAGFQWIAATGRTRTREFALRAADRFLESSGKICLCGACRGISVYPQILHSLMPEGVVARNLHQRSGRELNMLGTISVGLRLLPWAKGDEPGLRGGHMPYHQLVDLPSSATPGSESLVTRQLGLTDIWIDFSERPWGNPWLANRVLNAFGETTMTPAWQAIATLTATAGWWWFFEDFAVLSAPPVVLHTDPEQRLHAEDGPALCYPDGWKVNAHHGTVLPTGYFDEGGITLADIEVSRNLEIRRMVIDRYGNGRYMRDAGGRMVQSDKRGELWHIGDGGRFPRRPDGLSHPHMAMVHVVDATPAADGTRREYWLHVPPEMTSAREAVAWTFGLGPDEYRPEIET